MQAPNHYEQAMNPPKRHRCMFAVQCVQCSAMRPQWGACNGATLQRDTVEGHCNAGEMVKNRARDDFLATHPVQENSKDRPKIWYGALVGGGRISNSLFEPLSA